MWRKFLSLSRYSFLSKKKRQNSLRRVSLRLSTMVVGVATLVLVFTRAKENAALGNQTVDLDSISAECPIAERRNRIKSLEVDDEG